MSEADGSNLPAGAKYFGQTSPRDLAELERNAATASPQHLGRAALLLEQALHGAMPYAWFGGWAMKLRGVRRDTRDIDLLVQVGSTQEVRAVLQSQPWAILSYHHVGGIQERMFVNVAEAPEGGQVVGVDIVLAGSLYTPPDLTEEGSVERIAPAIETPQGNAVSVIHLNWQVECKLSTWMGRKKTSDYRDLQHLFLKYGDHIKTVSQYLDLESRKEFYEIYKAHRTDEGMRAYMKDVLQLEC
ncbi:hypothetical protein F5144DRAFT_580340 [Chaetomium tenue]|uniref:Uncharacterized protein n=1 Tax=Chaetomium tenue TaxID=1854479 RepID=A0ACB7P538_9PEZI|nr:hypothetical protein F5144DRAFT_580340 [Chaetomium globosum]